MDDLTNTKKPYVTESKNFTPKIPRGGYPSKEQPCTTQRRSRKPQPQPHPKTVARYTLPLIPTPLSLYFLKAHEHHPTPRSHRLLHHPRRPPRRPRHHAKRLVHPPRAHRRLRCPRHHPLCPSGRRSRPQHRLPRPRDPPQPASGLLPQRRNPRAQDSHRQHPPLPRNPPAPHHARRAAPAFLHHHALRSR